MSRTIGRAAAVMLLALAVFVALESRSSPRAAASPLLIPDAAIGMQLADRPGLDTAVFAGGCFWGVEAVFEHVHGVQSAVSGYAGGTTDKPSYDDVSTGRTGHAESVQVIFDPSQVSYGQLLRIFFSVVHDPTQLNRQGPDIGTHYRSAIFHRNEEQRVAATSYIGELTKAKVFPRAIVTQVAPLERFYMAEAYHQDFARLHPNHPYIVYHDAPKVANLKQAFGDLYREPAN